MSFQKRLDKYKPVLMPVDKGWVVFLGAQTWACSDMGDLAERLREYEKSGAKPLPFVTKFSDGKVESVLPAIGKVSDDWVLREHGRIADPSSEPSQAVADEPDSELLDDEDFEEEYDEDEDDDEVTEDPIYGQEEGNANPPEAGSAPGAMPLEEMQPDSEDLTQL